MGRRPPWPTRFGTVSEDFGPGITVASGKQVVTRGVNNEGNVLLHGYLVPAAAVPATALAALPAVPVRTAASH